MKWELETNQKERQKRVFVYSTHIGKSHRVSNFDAIDNANMEMEKRKRSSAGLMTKIKVLQNQVPEDMPIPLHHKNFTILTKTHLAANATSVCT